MNEQDLGRDLEQLLKQACVCSILRRILGRLNLIEDVCQDVLQKCVIYSRRRQQLPSVPLIRRIALNECYSEMRRRKRRPCRLPEGYDQASEETNPAANLHTSERSAVLRSLLETLSPKDQELIKLQVVEGWPLLQIASHAKLPVNTVKTRIRRAMARLREKLQRYSVN
jgi:RNA polymerase sigma-70 factor (ECF subfamily)